VEINREKSERAAGLLKDTIVIHGDGHDLELLQEIGLSQMEAMVAVTGSSETNIISCLMARNHGVKKTIAMVENIEYIRLSQEIGVHTIINKKLIAAGEFFRYVRKGPIVRLLNIYSVNAEVLEFDVPEKARITKKKIRDLNFPKEAIIAGVMRDDEVFITLGDFEILPKDRVIVFSTPAALDDVTRFFKASSLF
jgi:trk system potassium uptake protein TrkA